MPIGARIKARREALGYSVDDVAKKLGKNRATIYRYESDFIENMPVSVLEPIAQILETTPAALMGWDQEPDEIIKNHIEERKIADASDDEEVRFIARKMNKMTPEEKTRFLRLMNAMFEDDDDDSKAD